TGQRKPESGAASAASCDFQSPIDPTAFRRWLFSGLTPGGVGLFQTNVTLNTQMPTGEFALQLNVNGGLSNPVKLNVRAR
ncbi:MAG: hypothetical protein FJW38_21700, partial [Acidobacteria bacterium]|nr:hypothetical protein [Acidobacteriota bacterium]